MSVEDSLEQFVGRDFFRLHFLAVREGVPGEHQGLFVDFDRHLHRRAQLGEMRSEIVPRGTEAHFLREPPGDELVDDLVGPRRRESPREENEAPSNRRWNSHVRCSPVAVADRPGDTEARSAIGVLSINVTPSDAGASVFGPAPRIVRNKARPMVCRGRDEQAKATTPLHDMLAGGVGHLW